MGVDLHHGSKYKMRSPKKRNKSQIYRLDIEFSGRGRATSSLRDLGDSLARETPKITLSEPNRPISSGASAQYGRGCDAKSALITCVDLNAHHLGF